VLNSYLAQVQRFCRDQKMEFLDTGNITDYINRARREVVGRTQCVRILSTISGSIKSWTVMNGGSGYSNNPTLTITPPDFPSGSPPLPNGAQATATCIVQGGVIKSIDSQYGGAGYFQPQMTITDVSGTGATATPNVAFINTLNQGQERYLFSDVDLSQFPGAGPCYAVKGVSLIYANYRYSVPQYSWSVYQSMIRTYPYQYQYIPTFCSQRAQGTSGDLYLYPLPSQTYQMEWDMFCLPADLVDDQSVEIIPDPWTDTVPYFAAHLAFAELQNWNVSKYMLSLFDDMTLRKSNYARIGRVVNPYGRYLLPFMLGGIEAYHHWGAQLLGLLS
jgi:hypothetical protein